MLKKSVLLSMLLWPVWALCADKPDLQNWFNDPFFQVRSAIAACPLPLGPYLHEADIRLEEHGRVERGTSCWMAGRCAKPNAYMYDADIGKAVQQQFAQSTGFADTSLWVTVKRKFVWVEGCVAGAEQEAALQKLLQSVPDVEHILVNVMQGTGSKPPYEVRP
ncbi:BON domain-containing protein [Undibacterium sp.]|uniref:BON domain-containing protein n=1 Tax=Undibacterium sp. TaxID=1914977 RepID=UPI00374D0A36